MSNHGMSFFRSGSNGGEEPQTKTPPRDNDEDASAQQNEDDGITAQEPGRVSGDPKETNKWRMRKSYILLIKRSLLTPLPLLPLGFSVHISLTFSSTMLQWRSKALTRASNLRLFRHEISTWVCVRVAV